MYIYILVRSIYTHPSNAFKASVCLAICLPCLAFACLCLAICLPLYGILSAVSWRAVAPICLQWPS